MQKRHTTEADLVDLITGGLMDDELELIIQAAVARRRFLQDVKGAENQAAFKPGTKVRICGNIKPRYLIGARGTVSVDIPRRRGDLMVDIDPHYHTGRYSKHLAIPASCLEEVT